MMKDLESIIKVGGYFEGKTERHLLMKKVKEEQSNISHIINYNQEGSLQMILPRKQRVIDLRSFECFITEPRNELELNSEIVTKYGKDCMIIFGNRYLTVAIGDEKFRYSFYVHYIEDEFIVRANLYTDTLVNYILKDYTQKDPYVIYESLQKQEDRGMCHHDSLLDRYVRLYAKNVLTGDYQWK